MTRRIIIDSIEIGGHKFPVKYETDLPPGTKFLLVNEATGQSVVVLTDDQILEALAQHPACPRCNSTKAVHRCLGSHTDGKKYWTCSACHHHWGN